MLGIVNVVGSSIARETDGGIYMHAGPEVSVASTKAYTCSLVCLALLALHLGCTRDLSPERRADAVIEVPPSEDVLNPVVMGVPLQLFAYHCALALGRDIDQPRNLAKSVTVE